MEYKPKQMDYPYDALEPFMPAEFLQIHYEKHHIGYANKLNAALAGTNIYDEFPEIINLLKNYQKFEDHTLKTKIRELGGGVANHDFFWKSMKKDVALEDGDLKKEIIETWGSVENFKEDFIKQSMSLFGSGWTYLVRNKDKHLKIMKLFNQDNPWFLGTDPLLCVDVWEHSYYLEYKWDRERYLNAFWEVINWDFVQENYEESKKNRP